ncbi:MAG: polyhydroxybutyrate depolymerase [Thermoanaerobaculia bacterium]|jgi:polyhydroxybutyrate depolymerase|nr:polyhydroxybutyrate depolymerase [Thermoanaerobaculia bacterium]
MDGSVNRRSKTAVVILLALPALFALFDAVSSFSSNRNNGSLISSGLKRQYFLYVPKSYDRAKASPLVISMHGAAGWPAQQRELSEWNRLADSEGFLVVYPAGIEGTGPRIWHVERGGGLGIDVRFIADLIDKVATEYNIDRTRIYANGISNGGGMSFVLSCRLSDRIAAVGLVAAAQTLPWSWCTDPRPVPMIAFHGTADPQVPYRGGVSWVAPKPFPDISVWTAKWARRIRCQPKAIESRVAPDVMRLEYTHCADDAAVILYTIEDGGHTWPGGGPLPEWGLGRTTHSIDASAVMWAFFRAHPLRR